MLQDLRVTSWREGILQYRYAKDLLVLGTFSYLLLIFMLWPYIYVVVVFSNFWIIYIPIELSHIPIELSRRRTQFEVPNKKNQKLVQSPFPNC